MTDRHKCQAALREIRAGSRQIVELAFEQERVKFKEGKAENTGGF